MNQVLGELLDAVWRGICFAAVFAVVWPIGLCVVRLTPNALKTLGVW